MSDIDSRNMVFEAVKKNMFKADMLEGKQGKKQKSSNVSRFASTSKSMLFCQNDLRPF